MDVTVQNEMLTKAAAIAQRWPYDVLTVYNVLIKVGEAEAEDTLRAARDSMMHPEFVARLRCDKHFAESLALIRES